MQKISKISSFIRALITFVFILHITAYIAVIFFGDNNGSNNEAGIKSEHASSFVHVDFNGSWEGIAQALEKENFNSVAILGIAESIPYLFIYFFLFKLFGLYKSGIIFTAANINCIKHIGTSLLAWILLSILYPVAVTLFIRFTHLSETLPIIVNFGSTELRYLAIGLIVYVIAWVMREALDLQSEQELVI